MIQQKTEEFPPTPPCDSQKIIQRADLPLPKSFDVSDPLILDAIISAAAAATVTTGDSA